MTTVLMDTFNYEEYDELAYDEDKDYVLDVISWAKEQYENQYHTEAGGYFQIAHRESHYGAIGGAGLTGGRYVEKAEDLFRVNSDDIWVYVDEDGLHFDYYDHDGVNTTVLKFVTQAFLDKQDEAHDEHGFNYDQTVDYLIDKLPNAKGTTYKVFYKALGIYSKDMLDNVEA